MLFIGKETFAMNECQTPVTHTEISTGTYNDISPPPNHDAQIDISASIIFQSIKSLFETAFYQLPPDIAYKIYIDIYDNVGVKRENNKHERNN